jgi:2-polyprenyl-3-methyl-5-hydroxy-6-metoxy-1,4-benzoquinol methylase
LIAASDTITKPANTSFAKKDFERLYIASRNKENRVYTDEQVEQLPCIEDAHIHYHEWQVRKRSAGRLFNYLEKKNKPLTVLEAGCGNGWLSARLSAITGSAITGADINKTELDQARRVFGKRTNITFTEGNIADIHFQKKFDVIIFAAAVQYFPSFEEIIGDALPLLNKDGEIHITDSYFYNAAKIEKAKERSVLYYQSIGYGEMAEFYFHHSVGSLSSFNYKLLFNPAALKNKLFRKKDPFPWIRIMA